MQRVAHNVPVFAVQAPDRPAQLRFAVCDLVGRQRKTAQEPLEAAAYEGPSQRMRRGRRYKKSRERIILLHASEIDAGFAVPRPR